MKKSIDSTKKDYDKIASHYVLTRKHEKPEFQFFTPYIHPHDSILDIGCGTGRGYLFLRNLHIPFQYTGIDISKNQLSEACKQFPDTTFLEGDMTRLSFQEEQFDVVFMIASLHHLPSPTFRFKALTEAHRVLKKDGILCMTNWNLFQKRYIKYFLSSMVRNIVSLGKYSLRDFFIPWKNSKGEVMVHRYYHNFGTKEIAKLAEQGGFDILENFYTRGDKKAGMWGAYNLLTVLRKS